MRSHAKKVVFFLTGIASLAVAQTLPDLLTALRQSGASGFADRLESDPETLNLFLTAAQTVFAPSDLTAGSGIPQERGLSLAQRPSLAQRQQAASHGSQKLTEISANSMTLPGSTISTFGNSVKLGGDKQKVVIDNRPANTIHPARRWEYSIPIKRQSSITPGSLRVSSGLGKIANIVQTNIPFNKGLIHIVDDYFTIPQSLSSTTKFLGQTAFADLAASSNLTTKLDNTNSITAFLLPNAALSSSNNLTASAKGQLVSGHIVPDFVGYLPELKDGATLKSQTGQNITIRIRDGLYYINDAKIIQANIILDSGVAHVIDKPLTSQSWPTQPKPVPTSGSLPNRELSLALTAGLSGIVGLFALL